MPTSRITIQFKLVLSGLYYSWILFSVEHKIRFFFPKHEHWTSLTFILWTKTHQAYSEYNTFHTGFDDGIFIFA